MVQIYTAADGSYALQAAVLFKSLAETQASNVVLTILGNNWSRSQRVLLEASTSANCTFEVIEVPDALGEKVNLTRNFPLPVVYNLLGPLKFFQDQTRILYMDADTMVRNDLQRLYRREMGSAVAACIDAHSSFVASPSMWRPWREESIPPLAPALNTGVMLIDVGRWNEARITERSLELLSRYTMPCIDQDALNIVLQGEFDRLEPRYNQMPYHYLPMWRYADVFEKSDAINEALDNPVVVHFHRSFLGKPWNVGCYHPRRKEWRSLARRIKRGWLPKLSLMELARGQAARVSGMARISNP